MTRRPSFDPARRLLFYLRVHTSSPPCRARLHLQYEHLSAIHHWSRPFKHSLQSGLFAHPRSHRVVARLFPVCFCSNECSLHSHGVPGVVAALRLGHALATPWVRSPQPRCPWCPGCTSPRPRPRAASGSTETRPPLAHPSARAARPAAPPVKLHLLLLLLWNMVQPSMRWSSVLRRAIAQLSLCCRPFLCISSRLHFCPCSLLSWPWSPPHASEPHLLRERPSYYTPFSSHEGTASSSI